MVKKGLKTGVDSQDAQGTSRHAPKLRHPLLAAAAIGATLIGGSCAPSARAQETTPSRAQPVVAQAPAQPQARSDATPDVGERHYDEGGAIIGQNTAVFPMTLDEYHEQIEYMFDLRPRYEVRPGLNEVRDRVRTVRLAGQEFKVLDGIVVDDNSYITDEFVVRRSRGLGDRAPPGAIVIYVRNNLDGVRPTDPPTPLFWLPYGPEDRGILGVFRFRTTPTPVVGREVIALQTPGGIWFFHFNPLLGKYAIAGTTYGPDFFGPNPRIGVELSNQAGMAAIVIAREEDFTAGNMLRTGARPLQAALGLNGDPTIENGTVAVNYANFYEISE